MFNKFNLMLFARINLIMAPSPLFLNSRLVLAVDSYQVDLQGMWLSDRHLQKLKSSQGIRNHRVRAEKI